MVYSNGGGSDMIDQPGHDSLQRRAVKKLRRRLVEASEALSIRERIRNQWEVIELERRLSEGVDRRVRYALLVFGVTNAAAVLALARFDTFGQDSGPAAWAGRVFAVVYVILAVMILRDALRAMRPRLSAAEVEHVARQPILDNPAETLVSHGILPVGSSRLSTSEYHGRWQRITGEELSRQLSEIALACSGLAETKLAALRHLYTALALSVGLTACLVVALLLVPII
jgi:uncharacterized membrane protein